MQEETVIGNVYYHLTATKRRLLLYAITLLSSYLFYYLMDPYSEIWYLYLNDPFGEGIIRLLWMLFFSVINVEICLFVDHILMKYVPWKEQSMRRIGLQILFQILASVIIILFFDIIFTLINYHNVSSDYQAVFIWFAQSIANIFLVSLLISGMNVISFLLENWKKVTLESAELKLRQAELEHAATVAELQALKLQLDPHFIFNNLSALSEVILEDQQQGYAYAESFSEVYRYLMINSKKNTIILKDELEFIRAYLFMVNRRLGEGVKVLFDIDARSLTKEIPPMTLQLLVENAIKHNRTSKSNPLHIHIITDADNSIRVSNHLLPLVSKSTSFGLGLPNIVQRFDLLGFPKPLIEITATTYTVIIPLL